MGAWGIKSFENDRAMDWLGHFLENPVEETILQAFEEKVIIENPGLIGKLFGQKPKKFTDDIDGEEVLAAAEVVAYCRQNSNELIHEELKGIPKIEVSALVRDKAVSAINSILRDSDSKECWEEAGELIEWQAEVSGLLERLS